MKLFPKVALVSYPRAGRTQLRQVLEEVAIWYYQKVHKAPPPEERPFDFFWFTHNGSSYSDHNGKKRSPNKFTFRDRRVIILIRDPRDILISHWFFVRRRRPDLAKDFKSFFEDPFFGLKSIVQFYVEWWDARNIPESLMVLRYERIREKIPETIQEIVRFGRLPWVPDYVVKEAVAVHSLANELRRGALRSLSLPEFGGNTGTSCSTFEPGHVGNWKRHFSNVEKESAKRVMEKLPIDWSYE